VPLRPLSLGDIFNGTVNVARRNPAATFGLTAIVMTVYAVALALLHRFFGHPALVPVLAPGAQTEQHILGTPVSLPPAVVLTTYALELVANAVVTGLLSAVIGRAVLGHKISLEKSWRSGRFGAVLGTSVLLLLIEVVPPGVVALIVAALVVVHASLAAILVGVLGGLATVAYEAFVLSRLSLTMPALVLERVSPISAIRRSLRLSHRSFWRLLGILLLTYLVVLVAAFVLAIPFDVIGAVVAGSASTSLPAVIVAAVGTVVVTAVTRPVSAGVNVLLYADLRMRREGFDLTLRNAAQNKALTGDEFAAVWNPTGSRPVPPGAS
jgi:hypothetical protein